MINLKHTGQHSSAAPIQLPTAFQPVARTAEGVVISRQRAGLVLVMPKHPRSLRVQLG